MKKLFTHLPLFLLAMSLAAGCGKDNSSGTSSSANSVVDTIGGDGFSNVGQNFQTIDEVRNAFNAKSMSDGLSPGTDIYHVGSLFGGQSAGGFSAGYQVSGCLNLIFWEVGDCESGYENNNYYIQQMEAILNQGRLLKVVSANSNSVAVKKAVGVDGQAQFIYQDQTLNKGSGILAQMLSGDAMYTSVRPATITLSNGQSIEGVAIYNQYGVFVVTTNLPLAANPVYAQSGNAYGYLSKIGQNVSITNVSF